MQKLQTVSEGLLESYLAGLTITNDRSDVLACVFGIFLSKNVGRRREKQGSRPRHLMITTIPQKLPQIPHLCRKKKLGRRLAS
jgi:hypothetical protein